MSRSRRKDKPGINEHPAHYDHYEPQYPIQIADPEEGGRLERIRS